MNTTYTVGQHLLERLKELGLEHLFSIAGDYTVEWVNNYVEPSSVEVIEEVNELNAGYAADGYARLKGIAATCFTYSAGSLCAVNAIAGAYVERVPVVVINGSPNIKQRLTFEQTGFSSHHLIKGETDLNIYQNITAAAIKIDNPDTAPNLIDYALTQCITEKRPVYIELLDDMVSQTCPKPTNSLKPARTLSDPVGLSAALELIQKKLENAKNPLLWIGAEIDRFGLHAQTEALIKKLNIPYATELLCKGILSENDPQFAGVFDGQSSSPETMELFEKSDFVLALGIWLSDINSLGEGVNSYDAMALAATETVRYGSIFIPQVPLDHLLAGLLDAEITCVPQAQPQPPETPSAPDPDEKITYQGFYDFLQNRPYINDQTLLGSDASLNYFGSLFLKVGAPRGYIAQSSYSSIGYIGPAATGMCLAKNDDQRVIVFTGDGGFQMSAQCLSTQTRFGLNPILFVMDNGVYGVEQWLYDASVFTTEKSFLKSCVLHRWDYSKLADVFGCKGWEVNTYAELQTAIEEAIANTDSPSIIQIKLPNKSIPQNALWKKD